MNNLQYTQAVEAGFYPSDPAVPIVPAFEDARGVITNLLLSPITSVAHIVSRAGTVRANHLHRTDWHYAFVGRGKVYYFEREPGSKEIPTPRIFLPGDMFFTPPQREHAMYFPVETSIMTFAKNIRSHENHEADLVRVSFITPEIARSFE